MDEHTPQATPLDPDADEQPVAAQDALPFDEAADEPIAFALTARARRTVAPEAVPPLRIVAPGDQPSAGAGDAAEVDEDPGDTRPARARALRRAGTSPEAIARQLGVDGLLVRAWIDGVVAARSRRRAPSTAPTDGAAGPDEHERAAFELARADARAQAAGRLVAEPRLGAGLGVLAAAAEVEAGSVTVRTGDPRVAGLIVRWLAEALAADPTRLRVVLRVGPGAAGDLVRHRWARALGIEVDRLRTTRWVGAPADTAVEGLLRVVDADVAAAVAGWCDALLDGALEPSASF